MPVYAYASSNATPLTNPSVPHIIDLEAGDSYPASITLYGAGEDTTDPAATFTFQWTLLDPAPASADAPTLAGATTSTLTVTNVAAWRNYRFFLQVTSSTGTSSESSSSVARDQAFVTVQVKSEHAGLTKPAIGERNWYTSAKEWVEEIDTLAEAPPAHTIAFHSDTTATGAELDLLTGGAIAEDGSQTALHQHRGTHIPVATHTTRGTVQLEENVGTDVPAVLVNERITFTGGADFSLDGTGGKVDFIREQLVGSNTRPHVLFCAKEDLTITEYNVTLLDGGLASEITKFDLLFAANAAGVNAGTFTEQNTLTTVQASTNYYTTTDTATGLSLSVSAGQFFGVGLVSSSNPGSGAQRCLRVTIHATRKVIA